jgi:hypothetical protein
MEAGKSHHSPHSVFAGPTAHTTRSRIAVTLACRRSSEHNRTADRITNRAPVPHLQILHSIRLTINDTGCGCARSSCRTRCTEGTQLKHLYNRFSAPRLLEQTAEFTLPVITRDLARHRISRADVRQNRSR